MRSETRLVIASEAKRAEPAASLPFSKVSCYGCTHVN